MSVSNKNKTIIGISAPSTIIKGGEIQTVPTSGTTTVTKEMADIVSQSIGVPLSTAKTIVKETKK